MQFFLVLTVTVLAVSATKVDTSYDNPGVEYHYQTQPQQHHHQQLHTAVAADDSHQQYHHQHRHAEQSHQIQHHHIEEDHQEVAHEQKHYKHIPIINSEMSQGKDGSYKYAFETANGIHQQEHGFVKNAGQKDHEIQVAEGFYAYTDEHGHEVKVHYIADENGFRAVGDHLPTPPPLPEALKKAYAEVAAHPELYQEEPEEEQHGHGHGHAQVEEQPQHSYEHLAYQQAVANHHHHPASAPVSGHHAEYAHAGGVEEYEQH